MKTRRCSFIIEGERWGAHVVEQNQCRRMTADPSGRCYQHRSDCEAAQ